MFSIIYLCYVTCHTQWAWVTYADTCTGCWAYVLWWLSCNLFHLWKRRKIRATLLNEVRLETPGADFVYTFQNPPSYSEFWPTVKLLFWTPGYNEFCKALASVWLCDFRQNLTSNWGVFCSLAFRKAYTKSAPEVSNLTSFNFIALSKITEPNWG